MTILTILLAILVFGFLVFVHEGGHFCAAKIFGIRVNEFAIGMGPKIFSFGKGETTYSLRILPFGGFCAMEAEDEESEDPRAFTSAAPWKRLIVLAAGALMNLVTGLLILVILIVPSRYSADPVIETLADQYQEEGLSGLLEGDRFLKINGERVRLTSDISLLLSRYSSPYTIEVERNGEKITLEEVVLETADLTFSGEAFQGYGIRYRVADSSFMNNLRNAWYTALDYVRMIRFSLADMIHGKVSVKELSGPVGITQTMTQVAIEYDYSSFFNLAAFISINLGVMNLLPLPALDGGRLLFVLLGMLVRLFGGKALPYKYEGYVHLAGLVAFMLLFVFITYQDILKLL